MEEGSESRCQCFYWATLNLSQMYSHRPTSHPTIMFVGSDGDELPCQIWFPNKVCVVLGESLIHLWVQRATFCIGGKEGNRPADTGVLLFGKYILTGLVQNAGPGDPQPESVKIALGCHSELVFQIQGSELVMDFVLLKNLSLVLGGRRAGPFRPQHPCLGIKVQFC